jgi:hypothetical protein
VLAARAQGVPRVRYVLPPEVPREEQRSDRYYRFTLEGEAAPPPMPPINGLCNSGLCRPHLRP